MPALIEICFLYNNPSKIAFDKQREIIKVLNGEFDCALKREGKKLEDTSRRVHLVFIIPNYFALPFKKRRKKWSFKE
jgi:hypothetical protein